MLALKIWRSCRCSNVADARVDSYRESEKSPEDLLWLTAPAPYVLPLTRFLVDIADYVFHYEIDSDLAYSTARLCLIDSLGCALEALDYPACTKLLGPLVPGLELRNGARVPGDCLRARSGAGGVQHRHDDSLA